MSADLPPALSAAIAARLEGRGRAALADRARRQSERYRAGGGSAAVVTDEADALAYALARAPATYAACHAAFSALAELAALEPASLVDAGAGTGSASWAAAEIWPSLSQATFLDSNAAFLAAAGDLAARHPALAGAERLRGDLGATVELPPAELVIASYALAELPDLQVAPAALRLWAAARQALVIVEPGSPAGWRRVLAIRAALIEAGAHIAAPCPHEAACPIQPPDWCHFSQRLARSRDHRLAKAASVPFEDEKFIYIAALRAPATRPAARVVGPPHASKPAITLKLCTAAGTLEHRPYPRRDKPAYAAARRQGWGDAIFEEPAAGTRISGKDSTP
ncbi:MAG TPA: small ribosomal subunit Rsm22 family protein [Phenylobacterium sp.]|nr:small ribosomal subunit Rsm22 family protein [Phenylobacterium sp.]